MGARSRSKERDGDISLAKSRAGLYNLSLCCSPSTLQTPRLRRALLRSPLTAIRKGGNLLQANKGAAQSERRAPGADYLSVPTVWFAFPCLGWWGAALSRREAQSDGGLGGAYSWSLNHHWLLLTLYRLVTATTMQCISATLVICCRFWLGGGQRMGSGALPRYLLLGSAEH